MYPFSRNALGADIMPQAQKKTLKVDKDGYAKVTIQPDGGIIIVE